MSAGTAFARAGGVRSKRDTGMKKDRRRYTTYRWEHKLIKCVWVIQLSKTIFVAVLTYGYTILSTMIPSGCPTY
jgi:hypothetical protein